MGNIVRCPLGQDIEPHLDIAPESTLERGDEHNMDSRVGPEMRLAGTPAKVSREGDSDGDSATPASSLSSPSPVSLFARKNPPALSVKPRKANSLFASSPAPGPGKKGFADTSASSSVSSSGGRGSGSGGSALLVGAEGEEQDDTEMRWGGDGPTGGLGGSGVSGGACFASPARPSREALLLGRSRITPQRNLGGLFASPLQPPRDDSGSQSTPAASDEGMTLLFPRKLESPKRERLEEEAPRSEISSPPAAVAPPAAAATTAVAAAAVEEDTSGCVAPTAVGDALEDAAAPVSGQAQSPVTEGVCVSNEALRSRDSGAICTLEVLVKHSRERLGVSALACWRVAELKRRLVYLKVFAAPEAITLAPRFGGQALGDDVMLAALDTDVTYEARRVAIA